MGTPETGLLRSNIRRVKANKEACSEKPELNLELSNTEDISSTFSKIIMGKRKRTDSEVGNTKRSRGVDVENFIPYKPSDQHFEQGLAINNFTREANAIGVDLTGDTQTALDSVKQRKVWDKKKKRLVTVGGVSKEGKIKSESGAWIPASYKSGRYKEWIEKTKAHHADEDEEEEETDGNKRLQKRLHYTHWAKHNVKVEMKKKLKLKRPEQIVKAREQLERRRRRDGRKKKKGRKAH